MKNKYLVVISLLFLVSILLYGCQEESGDTVSLVAPPVEGPAVGDSGSTAHIDQPGGGSFVYTQNLGSTPQDVYFIFTNTGSSNITPATEVSSASSMNYKELVNNESNLQKNLTELQQQYLIEHTTKRGMRIKDSPLATQFNANPPKFGDMVEKSKSFVDIPPPLYADTTGDTLSFMNENSSDLIPATLRLQIVAGSNTVNLWVANDSWTGCFKANCMTQTMVEAFGDKFLKSGTSNDIWDWISNVYGSPWGAHSVSNLIDSAAANQIDILFFDISDDDSTTGGILGFFWAKDNFKVSSLNYSNERLMFYIDSVLTATEEPTDGTWEITDEWPAEMVSTLSHEFQHMINFYQKNVLRTNNVSSETWINEMSSMVAEDLIADKLGIDGPRGVAYNDGTAGSSGNANGRLPLYNGFSNFPLTTWLGGSSVLISYAMNYSFGAYIVRNFGGAELMQKITQSTFTGTDAIDNALSDLGSSETFSTILKKWGAAVLRSDLTTNTSGYKYNSGTYFTSTFGSDTHNLGSINLFNFDHGSQSGPLVYSPASLVSFGGHYATSNTFVLVGQNLTGEFSKRIEMPSGISLSVVTKNSN